MESSQGTKNNNAEVLIVEDSATQAEQLQHLLEEGGYTVRVASNGKQALVMARERKPSLIISDIVMPEMDGYTLSKGMKADEELKDIPVLLLTSLSGAEDVLKALQCGADNFLRKPYEDNRLLSLIEYMLTNRELRKSGKMRVGLEIDIGGERHFITSERQQILDLLISTFMDAVQLNKELQAREKELARSYQSLQGLYGVAGALNQATYEQDVLNNALKQIMYLPGVQAGWISLREGETGFRLAAACGLPPALEVPGAFEGDCLCRRKLLAGELDQTTNILECERLQQAKGDTRGLCCHASVPLWIGNRVVGVMNLAGPEQGLFSDEDLEILYSVGNQVAVALERTQLLQQMEKKVEERTAALTEEIAERRQAQEALRASEARYRRLFEAAKDGILILDATTGEIIDVNPFLIHLLQYPREEFLGRRLWEMGAFKDLEACKTAFRELQDKEQIRYEDLPLETSDGRLIAVEFVSNVYQVDRLKVIQCNIRDISDRRRTEEAMRASEERYRDLFENANDIIYTLNLEGNFTSLNKSGERITGYTQAEIREQNIVQLVVPESQELIRQLMVQKSAQEPTAPYEMEIVTKDGQRVALEVSNRLMYQQNGKPVGIQGIARDVTERKQLQLQLSQSQKMEAIGRLAGGVAHDFNNHLGIIIGYSELLLERLGPDDPLRKNARMIKEAGLRSAALTRQLLAFSRRQVFEPKVLNLNEVVTEIEKMLRPLIGEDIELVTLLNPELGKVRADPSQIDQVIMNLAVNSRDAMPQGGRLTIETANVELDESYARTHVTVQAGSYVMLAVSDTGMGMDTETQTHMFEPFFTTKEKGKGTGLGLAMAYGIVKQSGGYIWVYSEPGQGTTFKIYLPRLEAGVREAETERVSSAALQGEETVLLVEDEGMLRELAREFLQSSGYTVLEAGNGAEAIEVSKRHQGLIHLLMTDVVMPGMSGRELTQRMKGHRPDTKVLYVSGYTDDVVLRNGMLEPGTAFLQKPFTRDTLMHKVRDVLEGGKKATDNS